MFEDKAPGEGFSPICPARVNNSEVIRLGHGSGGKMTADLVDKVFLPELENDVLSQLDDAAVVGINEGSIAITTDSYVVSPIFFPGGDIGSLAVFGTVNDLAMRSAKPLYLTASFILEEGLPIEELRQIVCSIKRACEQVKVKLIAGDTKVVNRGAADKLYITTCGVGVVEKQPVPSVCSARVGDRVILSGSIGMHGIAIMCAREGLEIETRIVSDSAPLNELVHEILDTGKTIHCMRDVTRGGLASVLNELAAGSSVGIEIEEMSIPIRDEVKGACELLGLDPLYVACEGRFVAIVSQEDTDEVLSVMQAHPLGGEAQVIGRVLADYSGRVILKTGIGGRRIVDKLSGEQLPRIC